MALVIDLDQPLPVPPEQAALVVGGKAAGLNVMSAQLQLPVPPAFALTTEVCRTFLTDPPPRHLRAVVEDDVHTHLARMGNRLGRRFGDPDAPLLVSVRSGAPVSMPGMMDTVLNLGLTDETAAGLARATGDEAFARDCLVRFRALFRSVVGVTEVPENPVEQLRMAIEAVLGSWNSDRARAYREVEGIDDSLGTAVVVQAMVFGNAGPDSGTGVLFTRDPSTGAARLTGDVLFEAQGEDVVSGTHHPAPISALDERMPAVAAELRRHADTLERHYRDMCDIEFTVERGRLWLLQTRIGKRSPHAALAIAVDMASDPGFPLDRHEAASRVATLLADPPMVTTQGPDDTVPIAHGVPASPGLATGRVATDADTAERLVSQGLPVILVRPDTSPQDVPAMGRSTGVLTSRGGPASHAAVVARGWGIPAVVGAAAIDVRPDGLAVGGREYGPADTITIDGATGQVYEGEVRVQQLPAPQVATLRAWANESGVTIPAPRDAPGSSRDAGSSDDGPSATAPLSSPGADPGSDVGRHPDHGLADAIVGTLSVVGAATPDHLAQVLGASPDRLVALATTMAADGLLHRPDGPVNGTTILRLADAGTARAAALLHEDRTRCGIQRAEEALATFTPFDGRMKSAVTDWQMRDSGGTAVVNDHGDRAYDDAVLQRLADLHDEVATWLVALRGTSPTIGRYLDRLDAASAAVTGGDHRFIASPRVDSYHSVWFELHEYLIRLAGRTREDEAAAGRA